MLELQFIRDNTELVKKNLEKRKNPELIKWLNDLVEKDKEWRKLKFEVDSLRSQRNSISAQINQAKKEGKDVKKILEKAKKIPQEIEKHEKHMNDLWNKIEYYLYRIPNILDKSVPTGKDESENQELKKWGKIKEKNFELKPHGELIEELGVADFKTAAKVSGAGFNYLKGSLALLDLSLQRFAIDHLIKKGFTLIEPPHILTKEAYKGVTDLADFENVMYKIEGMDSYLIATSEHPLVSLFKDMVIEEKDLPIKLVGLSPCYRKEIGSHGVDSRGVFRMHQFNKVEQVVICRPEDSEKVFEEIQKNSEEIYQALEIPFRVVNICTGDIGIVASKKYDIEAYFPREKEYKEVGSCSNCLSYQAVRLNIKYSDGKSKKFVHTLNNTGVATSRTMRAIIENYQNKDGSIDIPKALHPYMNCIKKISKT